MKIKSYAAVTDQGPHLEINEDGYEFDLENQLFMVMDGFGGSGVGDKTVAVLKENIKTFYTRISADPDTTLPFFYSSKYLLEGNALINAMLHAHKLLCSTNSSLEMSQRGGASGIFAAVAENIITLVVVGNCTGYLYRQGNLKKVILEDSFKSLGHDDYVSHFQTMPMSAFGLFHELHFQVNENRIMEDDRLILITDGVYSRLTDGEIAHIAGNPDKDNTKKIENLFELANSRGNLDNQTAMILQF